VIRPLCLLLLIPATAFGFVQADDGDGNGLAWDAHEDFPIDFALHSDLSTQMDPWLTQNAIRRAFASWASVSASAVDFEEDSIYLGVPCPHGVPESFVDQLQAMCGAGLSEVDGTNAVFFMEAVWPFGPEVIGLTTVTWARGGRLVDADIALNGVDYRWTLHDELTDCDTDPAGCSVDLQSIVLHEAGHLLGLGHTTEPGAVMRVDYQQGNIVRELGDDDLAGAAALYPCASSPCSGDVDWPKGCSAAGGGGALLIALALLGGSRRARRLVLPLAALVLVPTAADSTTVRSLPFQALAQADAVVLATVIGSSSWADGIAWTRTELAVDEVLAGDAPDELELVQPGGLTDTIGTKVFGMPELPAGEAVLLFLERQGEGWRVLGLEQGKATVTPDGRLLRDVSGMALARVGTQTPAFAELPADLDGLRAALQAERAGD